MKISPTPHPYGPDILVRERIESALSLHRSWEARLRQDALISAGLDKLAGSLEAGRRLMLALGMVRACRWCEEAEGGSCCGLGIENRYGDILLLLNLLLGVTLPARREKPDSCYFLNQEGCCLRVRHVLCVNYLCGRLKETLSREGLIALQTLQGQELNSGFVLHEAVRKIVGL